MEGKKEFLVVLFVLAFFQTLENAERIYVKTNLG
jgi:hypothetical protein